MMQKRLLWDFGGTLADLTDSWSGLGIAALNDQLPGHTITREQIRPFLSSGFPWHSPEVDHSHISSTDAWWQEWIEPLFEQIFVALGVQSGIANNCAKQIRHRFLDPSNWHVFADTEPTLETLSDLGWSHAIISNFSPGLEELLEQLGLRAHFTHVFNSASIGFEKPNPRIFNTCSRRLTILKSSG
jgi:putative hydrolase of the HAD superfamily